MPFCLMFSATATRASDVSMLKGSLGSKMKLIVEALQRRFPAPGTLDDVAV
jgi:UDP-N-acetylmuramoyl-tripeptide--D-alanyl-D-alanine ligase